MSELFSNVDLTIAAKLKTIESSLNSCTLLEVDQIISHILTTYANNSAIAKEQLTDINVYVYKHSSPLQFASESRNYSKSYCTITGDASYYEDSSEVMQVRFHVFQRQVLLGRFRTSDAKDTSWQVTIYDPEEGNMYDKEREVFRKYSYLINKLSPFVTA